MYTQTNLGHCIYSFPEHEATESVLKHKHGPDTPKCREKGNINLTWPFKLGQHCGTHMLFVCVLLCASRGPLE